MPSGSEAEANGKALLEAMPGGMYFEHWERRISLKTFQGKKVCGRKWPSNGTSSSAGRKLPQRLALCCHFGQLPLWVFFDFVLRNSRAAEQTKRECTQDVRKLTCKTSDHRSQRTAILDGRRYGRFWCSDFKTLFS